MIFIATKCNLCYNNKGNESSAFETGRLQSNQESATITNRIHSHCYNIGIYKVLLLCEYRVQKYKKNINISRLLHSTNIKYSSHKNKTRYA